MYPEPDGFREAVRTAYDDLGSAYADQRGDNAPLLDSLLETLPHDARVLDVGCGPAIAGTPRLAERGPTVGLDASRTQLALARDRLQTVAFVQGDATALPFRDRHFDGLVEYHAVVHVPRSEQAAVYREFARVLRPGGRAVVTAGTEEWTGSNADWLDTGTEMHWRIADPDTVRSLLTDAGFVVEAHIVDPDPLGGEWGHLLVRREAE